MLSEKILEMRNKAHETNAANKIIDMLVKLRKSNNELSKRRWIWELIQNAKDAVNSTNKVNISITCTIHRHHFNELVQSVLWKEK